MLPDYDDIRSLIDRKPDWFDDNGVPRYAPFHPNMLGVYDRFAIYAEIGCQHCDERFHVGVGTPDLVLRAGEAYRYTLEELAGGFHYGDPPRHSDERNRSCVGDTMNCDDHRIIEAWTRSRRGDWERMPDLEGPIYDEDD